ncbi:MAG: CCA tRNA nucleotidyltransferase [Lentisphaeria bacterium]|nr:CCA tRNA nucleotidyltransferase [Lentisphaeria bacterium]
MSTSPVIQSISLPPRVPAEAEADRIIGALRANGFAGYRVGGAVRDRLLGRASDDVDVATDAVPAAVKSLFPHSFAVGENFGVIIVHARDGVDIEVATFRADGEYADGRRPANVRFSDMATDARRRDFTVNALYYDPVAEEIHDHTDGLADLRRGVIRAVGTPARRFEEDRLRMLRAIRFATSLRFELDKETRTGIQTHADTICDVSPERIFAELNKMLTGPAPAVAINLLSDCGLLRHILPEVEAMKGVEQPPEFHPEGDVWTHTMLMLENLRWPSLALAWSVLLHDVGKPPTQTHDGGRFRFNGHARVSADMTQDILRRLRSSKKLRRTVSQCVNSHMKFMSVQEMRRSTLRQFINGETFPLELELHRLDCLGSHADMTHYHFILDTLIELAAEPAVPQPLLTGHDLIRAGMRPGKQMGKILADIQEKQLDGRLKTREEALQYVSGKR